MYVLAEVGVSKYESSRRGDLKVKQGSEQSFRDMSDFVQEKPRHGRAAW